jgi:hypothetical protein
MGLIAGLKEIFYVKTKLRAVLQDELNNIHILKVLPINGKFTIKFHGIEESYNVDSQLVYNNPRKKWKMSFYNAHDPNPLNYQHYRNRDLDAESFKKVLDDKTITDLFSMDRDKRVKLLMVICAINAVLTLMILLVQFKVIKVGGVA